ncbi:hypothetical protein ACOSQ3_009742 [Xanthoceras sorbifolium]
MLFEGLDLIGTPEISFCLVVKGCSKVTYGPGLQIWLLRAVLTISAVVRQQLHESMSGNTDISTSCTESNLHHHYSGCVRVFLLGVLACSVLWALVNGPRKFSTNRDNAYSDFPRYHDGKFGSGKWEDNLGSGRRKSSSSEDNPVTISVKHVEEGVKGVVCNNNISSLLVGLDSVREENVKKGVMVPYVCIDSGMFHFVEDFGKVTGNIMLREVDNDMRASLAGGLYSRQDQL